METGVALNASRLRAETFVPPYPPSWFDRLLDWLEGLPGGWWLYVLALALAQLLYVNALLWLNGKTPVGSIELARSFFALLLPYVLAFWLSMRPVAKRALAGFRPVLDVNDAEFRRLEYQLITLPAHPVWLATGFFILLSLLLVALIPVSVIRDYASSHESALLQFGVVLIPSAIFSLIGVYRAFHQLRMVQQNHRLAQRINLYHPPPLYAFSAVTARIGIGLLLPAYFIFAADPEITLGNPVMFSALGVTVLVAIAAFVLPLREMHMRLVDEKGRLLEQVQVRFEALVTRLHMRVDANDLDKMDDLNKALAALVMERDTLERIPTWPWARGTLAGFVTALLLPIVLWLITAILGRILQL